MNTKEAIQALIEGHKVRNKMWSSPVYMYFDEDTLFDSNGNKFNTIFMSFSDDWEIYEEPKQTVTIERWLCKYNNYYAVKSTSDIDTFLKDNIYVEKVKLLDTRVIELP